MASTDKAKKTPWYVIVLIFLVVGAGVAAKIWWDRWRVKHGEGTTHSTVRLEGGTVVAIESVTIRNRRRDPSTDQIEHTEETHWRLRSFEESSGKTLARIVIDGYPTCKAAKGARVWCRWGKTTRLLDAQLTVVGEISGVRGDDLLQVDVEGGLLRMGSDGRPERFDPLTMEITRGDEAAARVERRPAVLSPMVKVGSAVYTLAVKRGQLRASLERSKSGGRSKVLEPKQSWIAEGFLGDTRGGPGDALTVPDGFFLVHRDNTAKDSQHRLTRLTLEGKAVWTALLPEPVEAGVIEGDGVVVSGRDYSVKLALADGKQVFQTRH